MSAQFDLEILTPEKLFFSERVEALTVTTVDGQLTVLAGHMPLTAPLDIGVVRIKQNGQWREAFQSEGFLEVDGGANGAMHVFAQAVEWPEEIDAKRAEEAERRARARMRQQRSRIEYQWSKIALARAMTRLKMTKRHFNID